MPDLTLPYGMDEWQKNIPLILAVQSFPNDVFNRTTFALYPTLTKALLSDEEHITLTREQVSTLIKAPSYEAVIKEGEKNLDKAITAGTLLLRYFLLHSYEPALCSTNRVVFWMEEDFHATASASGRIKASSSKSIYNAWKGYRSVASIAAAICYCESHQRPMDVNGSRDDFVHFLGAVSAFQDFASGHKLTAPLKTGPLIHRDEHWHFNVPFDVDAVELLPLEIAGDSLKRIKSYQAPIPAA